MNKLTRIIQVAFLVFGLSIVFTSTTFAAVEPNTVEASVFGGVLFGDDVGRISIGSVTFKFNDMDRSFGGGASLGYNFTKNLGIEGSISYWPSTDFTCRATSGATVLDVSTGTDQLHLFANGIYYIFPDKKVVPYITAGVGMVRFSGDVNALGQTVDFGENDFAYNAGAGIKWFFSDSFNLRVDGRCVVSAMEDLDTMYMPQVTVGIGYTF